MLAEVLLLLLQEKVLLQGEIAIVVVCHHGRGAG